MRDFNQWLSKFKSSISNYGYYVDFEKIYKSAEKYKVELNILNSLIGSKNIEKDFFKTDIGEAIKKAADGKVSDKDLFIDYQDFVNKANTLGKWDERRGEFRGSLAEMFYSERGSRGSLKRIMNSYNVRNLNEVGEELYQKLYAWKQAGQPNTRKDIQKYFGK